MDFTNLSFSLLCPPLHFADRVYTPYNYSFDILIIWGWLPLVAGGFLVPEEAQGRGRQLGTGETRHSGGRANFAPSGKNGVSERESKGSPIIL